MTPPTAPTASGEPLDSQVNRLAEFIMREIPGEPSQSEGAIDCAIRLLSIPERDWTPTTSDDVQWLREFSAIEHLGLYDDERKRLVAIAAALLAARRGEEDAKRLDEIEWFGCNTGDCPHSKQSECDTALLGVVRSVLAERESARFLAAAALAAAQGDDSAIK